MAIPIVGANLLQTAYQLIDTFWVGRLGADAVAAVSLSFPLMFLLLAVGSGIAVAGTVLVAQYQGMGDSAMVDYLATDAGWLFCRPAPHPTIGRPRRGAAAGNRLCAS